jgi:hypothetical protein
MYVHWMYVEDISISCHWWWYSGRKWKPVSLGMKVPSKYCVIFFRILDNHLFPFPWLRILTGYKHIGGDIGSFYCKELIQGVTSLSESHKSFWHEKRIVLICSCFKSLNVIRKTRFVIWFLGMSSSILLWIVSHYFQYKYRILSF